MKRIISYVTVSIILAGLGILVSAGVNLTQFAAGDLIKAAEVNANFDSLADELVRIDRGTQTRVAGICEEGSSIRAISEDGSVDCETDDVGTGGGSTYTAGTGLDLNGISFSLSEAYQLPQSCGNGQIPEWTGTGWACSSDDVGEGGGGGDITGVSAGAGLQGGAESGNASLSVDTTTVQSRVSGSCPDGSAISGIAEDGAVTCETDDVGAGGNAYSAGGGLTLTDTTFAVNFGADGAASSAARSDHTHVGQTWTGTEPLVLDTAVASTAFSAPDGAPLVIRNSGNDGDGIKVLGAAGNGLQVITAGRDGVYINSADNDGIVVMSADNYGGWFRGDSAGVYADGLSGSPDIILGDSGNNDDGVISSSPNSPGSDIFLNSNDAVVFNLDANNDETGQFEVRDGAGERIFIIDEAGELEIFDGTTNRTFWLQADGDLFIDGTLTEGSDQNAKQDIQTVDTARVLEKLASVPVSTWAYKASPEVTHIGPMAQDFYAAFAVGASDTAISTIDRDGVALAAIQGLYDVVQEKNTKIEQLEKRLAVLERARLATK